MIKKGLIVLGIVLAGAAGVLAFGGDEPEHDAESASEATAKGARRSGARGRAYEFRPRTDADVETRVADLEREVRELRALLGMRRFAGAVGEVATVRGEDGYEGEAMLDEGLREQVRSVLEEQREEDRQRWEERRSERFERRTEETIEAIAAVGSGLSSEQRETLAKRFAAEREQMQAIFRDAREDERPRFEIRDEVRKIREATDTELRDLLDADQFAAYEELRGQRGGWGRGWGGGPRGGGPPGRGRGG
jgi:hypothetical protein